VNYKIRTLTDFDKSFKRLSKKYNSLGKDLKELLLKLQEKPQLGTSLGNNFFKIRLKITSKSTGKSGGARIITCVKVTDEQIFLTYIYHKSEESTVSDKSLKDWAKLIE
jgi:hypothetical protein